MSFLQRKLDLLAELTSKQKSTIRDWARPNAGIGNRATAFSDHAFGNTAKTRQTVELEPADKPADPKVAAHLDQYGWEPESYIKGLARQKANKNKKQKIGKVLEATKAPEDVKQAFMNDPNRAAGKQDKWNATISRNPYDVASCSTDRGWKSCMGMNTSDRLLVNNTHHLPHDIKHGTHVAYMHRPDDPTISNPAARISLKPYIGTNGHKVLRPEETTYGSGNQQFRDHVENWAKKHFPMHDNVVYSPHEDVYNDSMNSDKMNVTDIGEAVRNHKGRMQKLLQAAQEPITNRDEAIDVENSRLRLGLPGKIKHSDLDKKKLSELTSKNLGKQLLSHYADDDLLHRLSVSPNTHHNLSVAESPNLKPGDAYRLGMHDNPQIAKKLARSTKHKAVLEKLAQHRKDDEIGEIANKRLEDWEPEDNAS